MNKEKQLISQNIIRVKIFSGLGNQMFQYACARAIQEKFGGDLYLDIYNFKFDKRKFGLNNFKLNDKIKIIDQDNSISNVQKNKILKILCKFMPKLTFKICSCFGKYLYLGEEYIKIDKNNKNNYYLFGYWQSEKYFKDIKSILQKEFELKSKIKSSHQKIINEMKEENSVAIHFRRGDYLNINKYSNICTDEYYKKAIKIINDKVENPMFYIFSDDIEYAKSNWNFGNNVKFIDEKNNNYEDINLMKHCKHYIIANSSFSWWGQYLSQNENKIVIAPKKWYNNNHKVDIYMEDWIKI